MYIQIYAFCNRHIPHIAYIVASRDIRTIRDVSTVSLRFYAVFYAMTSLPLL